MQLLNLKSISDHAIVHSRILEVLLQSLSTHMATPAHATGLRTLLACARYWPLLDSLLNSGLD